MENVKESNQPGTLGEGIADLDRRELCDLIVRLCDLIQADVGTGGYRGGVFPGNISISEGVVHLGPAADADWKGQERDFLAPELFWHGQKSPAADVYSLGLLLYYAVNSARLPFYKSGEDGARQRRMNGEAIRAPKAAGRRLSEIIEKATAFQAADRYQTVEELKAALLSCVNNIYLSGPLSAETLYQKNEEELSRVEQLMLDILRKEENPEIVKTDNEEEQVPQEPIVGPLMNEAGKHEAPPDPAPPVTQPPQEEHRDEPIIILEEEKNPELEPVVIDRSAPLQYQNSTERERKIAGKVRRRRLRPVLIIALVCVILLTAAYIRQAIENRDLKQQLNTVSAEDVLSRELPDPESAPVPVVEATPEPSYLPLDTPKPSEVPKETRYEIVLSDENWTTVKEYADHTGGHLVVINSDEEYRKVVELAELKGVTYVWIGGRRVDGAMTWLDGTAVDQNDPHWCEGEPTVMDNGSPEDYLILIRKNGSWGYNDIIGNPAERYPDIFGGKIAYVIEIES